MMASLNHWSSLGKLKKKIHFDGLSPHGHKTPLPPHKCGLCFFTIPIMAYTWMVYLVKVVKKNWDIQLCRKPPSPVDLVHQQICFTSLSMLACLYDFHRHLSVCLFYYMFINLYVCMKVYLCSSFCLFVLI